MLSGAKLLLLEMVVIDDNEPSFAKILDLEMLLMPGGKERAETEYRELFAQAGFALQAIHLTTSPMNIVEAVKL